MKEEDLKKNLDKIIIDGLIKEAEQENADFEAAMKKMSNEDFLELIMDHEHVADEVCKDMTTGEQTKLDAKATVYRIKAGLDARNQGTVIRE